jgi:hypothetical protein
MYRDKDMSRIDRSLLLKAVVKGYSKLMNRVAGINELREEVLWTDNSVG